MTDSLSFISQPTEGAGSAATAPEPRTGGVAPVVVWDLDGTLVRSDTLVPFLWRLLGPAVLVPAVAGAATHAAPGRQWRTAGKMRLLHAALAGRDVAAVDQVARRYAADLVAHRLRPDCVRRWRWHRAQGHRLVIASASPDVYVRQVGLLLGARDVICTELQTVDGRFTGRLATANCRGEEKARRLLAYLAAYRGSRLWVYADGAVDRPALALAEVAVRVSPYRPLRDSFPQGTAA